MMKNAGICSVSVFFGTPLDCGDLQVARGSRGASLSKDDENAGICSVSFFGTPFGDRQVARGSRGASLSKDDEKRRDMFSQFF